MIDGKADSVAVVDPIDGSWEILNIDIPMGRSMMNLVVRPVRVSGADAGLGSITISVTGKDYVAALVATQVALKGEPAGDIEATLRYRVAQSVKAIVNPCIKTMIGGRQ